MLESFEEFEPPDVGEKAASGREVLVVPGLGTAFLSFVIWTRGPIVGSVGTLDFSPVDRSDDNRLLAKRMDLRIVRSLAGEDLGAPDIPEPEPTPVPGPQDQARNEGFELISMVLDSEDLPEDTPITLQGFVEGSSAIATYTRNFVPGTEGLISLGDSFLVNITSSVELEANEADARAPVESFPSSDSLDFQTTGQQLGFAIARGFGFDPLEASTTPLDLGELGDVSVGVSVDLETGQDLSITAQVFLFARGRIEAQVFVLGFQTRTFLADTLALAQLVDQHIQEFSSP